MTESKNNKREGIKTTIKQIIEYWKDKHDEKDLLFWWNDADKICWGCGTEKSKNRNLDRCHIIPYSCGGKDIPSNYVLLCNGCHKEGPNILDDELMWDWLKSRKQNSYMGLYNTHNWITALNEYNKIYNTDLMKELCNIAIEKDLTKEVSNLFNSFKSNFNPKDISLHYGEGKINTLTRVGIWKKMYEFIKRYEPEPEYEILIVE